MRALNTWLAHTKAFRSHSNNTEHAENTRGFAGTGKGEDWSADGSQRLSDAGSELSVRSADRRFEQVRLEGTSVLNGALGGRSRRVLSEGAAPFGPSCSEGSLARLPLTRHSTMMKQHDDDDDMIIMMMMMRR